MVKDVKLFLAKFRPSRFEQVFEYLEDLLSQEEARKNNLVLALRWLDLQFFGPQFPLLKNEGIKSNWWFSKL